MFCVSIPAGAQSKDLGLDEFLKSQLSENAAVLLQRTRDQFKKNSDLFLEDPEKFGQEIAASLPEKLREEAEPQGSKDARETVMDLKCYSETHANLRLSFHAWTNQFLLVLEYEPGRPWVRFHWDADKNFLGAEVVEVDQKFWRAERLLSFNERGESAGILPLQRVAKVVPPVKEKVESGEKEESDTILIAVIDTDINLNHPKIRPFLYRPAKPATPSELRPDLEKLWTLKQRRELTDDPAEILRLRNEMRKIRIDLAKRSYAWDFVEDDPWPSASPGLSLHGTHVASLITAGGKKISIFPITAPNGDRDEAYYEAVILAHTLGARIFNISRGDSDPRSHASLEKAFSGFLDTLFVCSAGNVGDNLDQFKHFPVSFDGPNVLRVAATDSKGSLAKWNDTGSNFGLTVQVAALGVDVPGADADDEKAVRIDSGTSLAAPLVSKVAGLMKAERLALTPEETIELLMATAQRTEGLRGFVASGLVDEAKALAAVQAKNKKK